jgi:choline dehydrogenase-like flavoprotein
VADIEADIVIVGSGIAGALLAARLARAGVKVAILEAGPRVNRDAAVRRFWNAAIRVPECPYPPTPRAEHPISNDPDYWYRQTGPDKFKSTYLKVVGGTTWHWLGTCLRFMPNDFRLKSTHGLGVDWPISYDELEPFYGEAEREIGVSGDSTETLGSPRSSPYPMPPIPQTFLDRAYIRALDGTQFEIRATPQGRNAVEHDERPACCGNASCIPVCPDWSRSRGVSMAWAARTNTLPLAIPSLPSQRLKRTAIIRPSSPTSMPTAVVPACRAAPAFTASATCTVASYLA